jgi:outer membrane protein TolC
MQTSFEAAEAAASGLTPAVAGYNLTKALFREGLSSYIELMDAQTAMMRAKMLMLGSQYQFMKDRLAFEIATGNITIQ